MLHIVIPARNEAPIIRSTLERLCAFLVHEVHEPWMITIADNESTDATRAIVRVMMTREPCIELLEIPNPGKGGTVLTAWKHATPSHSPSPGEGEKKIVSPLRWPSEEGEGGWGNVFVFMDADLATDLNALPKLIATIRNGADIAVGSRYARGAHVERGILRRIISRCNQVILRTLFGLRVADATCGFKAVNERVIREIVPSIRDTRWFFDTELLIRAQRAEMRIVEIPVAWREMRRGSSFTKVIRIIAYNLRAIALLICERSS